MAEDNSSNQSDQQTQAPAPAEVVNTQPVTAPQQPVPAPAAQYVVMEKSIKGVGGWLIFFMISFGISAVYGLIAFFVSLAALVGGGESASAVVTVIFAPLIAAASVAAIVFIAMQKKLGKWISIGTLALTGVYATVLTPVAVIAGCSAVNDFYSSYSSYYTVSDCPNAAGVVGIIGSIFVSWVVAGLYALYFFLSKRVKATLVK